MIETILLMTAVIIMLSFVYAGIVGAPWVPTRKKDIERFIKLANAESGQVFYDIGCGDGRLVIAAAKEGLDSRGLEISVLPFVLAKARQIILWRSLRYKIMYKNLWNFDLHDADVVFVWLMPNAMPKLKQKFEKELRPGTKVISYVWPIDGLSIKRVSKKKGFSDIYLYEM